LRGHPSQLPAQPDPEGTHLLPALLPGRWPGSRRQRVPAADGGPLGTTPSPPAGHPGHGLGVPAAPGRDPVPARMDPAVPLCPGPPGLPGCVCSQRSPRRRGSPHGDQVRLLPSLPRLHTGPSPGAPGTLVTEGRGGGGQTFGSPQRGQNRRATARFSLP
ncbi:unnamed protein product, partial [Gulo gulo]